MTGQADELETVRSWVDAARRIVFFTGAGISTESGIPDFRSPGTGLWTKMKPIDFQEFIASEEVRTESWRRRFASEDLFTTAVPNRGHRAIAELVRQGRCHAVVTQNVDSLHQDSGVDSARVIELHGNATYAACLSCSSRYELSDLQQAFAQDGRVPDCSDCGGIIKSATISFGQAMPEAAMARAHKAIAECDLFIVAGSSLVVYPAAAFPEIAQQQGARLVIINREPTPLDDIADAVLRVELGPALGDLAQVN